MPWLCHHHDFPWIIQSFRLSHHDPKPIENPTGHATKFQILRCIRSFGEPQRHPGNLSREICSKTPCFVDILPNPLSIKETHVFLMVIHTFFNRVFTITQVFPVHKLTQTKSTISGCAGLGVSRISSYLFHLYKLVKINNKQMLIISTNIYIYPLSWSLSHKNKITHDCSSQKYPNQKKHFSIYDIYMVQYLLMYYSIV
jgi:hypothetical protein